MAKQVIAAVAFLVVLAGVVGCQPAREATPERKLASFAVVADVRIGGEPIAAFARSRSALLLCGVEVLGATVERDAWHVDFGDAPPDAPIEAAAAVALTQDGYFLTCAHAVGRRPGWLCVVDAEGVPRCVAMRVVWSGDPERGATDLALVHADGLRLTCADWASDEDVRRGCRVIGWGSGGASGRLTSSYVASGSRLGSMLAYVDVPTCAGDSGGPVLTVDGHVIGIVSRIKGDLRAHAGETEIVRPHLGWVAQLIAADRRARAVARR